MAILWGLLQGSFARMWSTLDALIWKAGAIHRPPDLVRPRRPKAKKEEGGLTSERGRRGREKEHAPVESVSATLQRIAFGRSGQDQVLQEHCEPDQQ